MTAGLVDVVAKLVYWAVILGGAALVIVGLWMALRTLASVVASVMREEAERNRERRARITRDDHVEPPAPPEHAVEGGPPRPKRAGALYEPKQP